jgi:hypothetical protein
MLFYDYNELFGAIRKWGLPIRNQISKANLLSRFTITALPMRSLALRSAKEHLPVDPANKALATIVSDIDEIAIFPIVFRRLNRTTINH